MATPEGKVKAKIKKWLASCKFFNFSPIGGAYAVHGIPDIIVCAAGKFIAIECKAPGRRGSVTKHQELKIAEIRASGGTAFVATCLDDVILEFAHLGLVPAPEVKPTKRRVAAMRPATPRKPRTKKPKDDLLGSLDLAGGGDIPRSASEYAALFSTTPDLTRRKGRKKLALPTL